MYFNNLLVIAFLGLFELDSNYWNYKVIVFSLTYTLQIYTAGIGTHVKSVKVTSICHRYYHVKV